MSPTCPECGTGPDLLYGFEVLTRWLFGPYSVIVERCWGCGYHWAYHTDAEKSEAQRLPQ